jgi:hypothetical protein
MDRVLMRVDNILDYPQELWYRRNGTKIVGHCVYQSTYTFPIVIASCNYNCISHTLKGIAFTNDREDYTNMGCYDILIDEVEAEILKLLSQPNLDV